MDKRDFFQVINTFYTSYGSLPSITQIKSQTKLSKKEIYSLLRALNNKTIHDFYFGKNKEGNIYFDVSSNFLNILAVIIGVFTFIASSYLTYIWFHSFFNWFISGIISITIVGTNFIFFNIVFKKTKKEKLKNKKISHIIIWFIAFLISILTTIAGQINEQMEKDVSFFSETSKQKANVEQKESYNDQIKDKKEEVKQLRDERKLFYDEFSKLKEKNDEWYNLNRLLNNRTKKIDNLLFQIEKLESKKEVILSQGTSNEVKERKSFFDWLSEIFKINSSIIQLIIFLIPGCLIDWAGPICLSLFTSNYFNRKE